MRCYGFRDAAEQGAGFQRAMIGNRKVVRPFNGGRQANVGAVLLCALDSAGGTGVVPARALTESRKSSTSVWAA
jgi:hypothetical protein